MTKSQMFVVDNHPVIPPSDLLKKWEDKWFDEEEHPDVLLIQAYQAGADEELAACKQWMQENKLAGTAEALHAARRPKPPSLKEQALEQLEGIATVFRVSHGGNLVCDTIRRALEALPDND